MRKKILFIFSFMIFIIFFINFNNSYADIGYPTGSLPIDDECLYGIMWLFNDTYYCITSAEIPKYQYYDSTNNEFFWCNGTKKLFKYSSGSWVQITDNSSKLEPFVSLPKSDNRYFAFVNYQGACGTMFRYLDFVSNYDIYDTAGNFMYSCKYNFEINLFEDTAEFFSTSYFTKDEIEKTSFQIGLDGKNYYNMTIEYIEQIDAYAVWEEVDKNGTYYIKITKNDSTELILKYVIDGIDESAHSLNLHLSTEEQTTEPIYILSNKYYYQGEYNAADDWLLNYDIDIAYGLESPYEFSPFSIEGTDENGNFRQYQYKIVVNGIYKAKILNLITGEISYQTFNVSNIGIKNKYGEDVYYNNYNDKGEFDPTPILFLEYVDTTTVRIRTQPFIFNELMYLECYFSSDNENYKKINNTYKYSIDTGNSSYDYNTGEKQNIQDLYYFYYDVQSDGIYYFKFYNIDLKKYTIGSIEVNIQEFLINNVDNIDKYPDKFVLWANQHFGVLTYPFTFCVNLFGKISNINYSEPVLHIPELKEPIGNHKILDSIDFNFNSVIENPAAKNIYNIYLVSVDFTLIILFLILCKNVFSEVFSK